MKLFLCMLVSISSCSAFAKDVSCAISSPELSTIVKLQVPVDAGSALLKARNRTFIVSIETKNPGMRPPINAVEVQGKPRLSIGENIIDISGSVTARSVRGSDDKFVELEESGSSGAMRVSCFAN